MTTGQKANFSIYADVVQFTEGLIAASLVVRDCMMRKGRSEIALINVDGSVMGLHNRISLWLFLANLSAKYLRASMCRGLLLSGGCDGRRSDEKPPQAGLLAQSNPQMWLVLLASIGRTHNWRFTAIICSA